MKQQDAELFRDYLKGIVEAKKAQAIIIVYSNDDNSFNYAACGIGVGQAIDLIEDTKKELKKKL